MTEDDLDIPEFLRRPKDWTPEPDRKRRRWTREMTFAAPPTKVEEKATRELRKELERAAAAKKAARFAALKEMAAERKLFRKKRTAPLATRRGRSDTGRSRH